MNELQSEFNLLSYNPALHTHFLCIFHVFAALVHLVASYISEKETIFNCEDSASCCRHR
jgi:hypothetical protein